MEYYNPGDPNLGQPIVPPDPLTDVRPIPPENADDVRRAETNALLRSGRLRYTPQQMQQMNRNAMTKAWLKSDEVPPDVRERELARLGNTETQIEPIPVPAHEWPATAREKIDNALVLDTEGNWGAPGTTWAINKSGQPEASRNAPNNDLEYIQNQGAMGPGQAQDSRSPYEQMYGLNREDLQEVMPDQVPLTTHSGAGRQPSSGMGPWDAQRAQDGYKATEAQMKADGVQQQLQQKQNEADTKTKQAAVKQRQDDEKARYDAIRDRTEAVSKRAEATHDASEAALVASQEKLDADPYKPDYDAARITAIAEINAEQDDLSYSRYLRDKFIGTSPDKLKSLADGGDQFAKDYLNIRRGRIVGAPEESKWSPPAGPVVPDAAMDRLRSSTPQELEQLRHDAMSVPPMTLADWMQKAPGESYEAYLATYRWAGQMGQYGQLQVPGGQPAVQAQPPVQQLADLPDVSGLPVPGIAPYVQAATEQARAESFGPLPTPTPEELADPPRRPPSGQEPPHGTVVYIVSAEDGRRENYQWDESIGLYVPVGG